MDHASAIVMIKKVAIPLEEWFEALYIEGIAKNYIAIDAFTQTMLQADIKITHLLHLKRLYNAPKQWRKIPDQKRFDAFYTYINEKLNTIEKNTNDDSSMDIQVFHILKSERA